MIPYTYQSVALKGVVNLSASSVLPYIQGQPVKSDRNLKSSGAGPKSDVQVEVVALIIKLCHFH